MTVSISAVDKFIRQQLGYRYKKTVFTSERKREDVGRQPGSNDKRGKSCDLSKLVFLVETGLRADQLTGSWSVDQAMN